MGPVTGNRGWKGRRGSTGTWDRDGTAAEHRGLEHRGLKPATEHLGLEPEHRGPELEPAAEHRGLEHRRLEPVTEHRGPAHRGLEPEHRGLEPVAEHRGLEPAMEHRGLEPAMEHRGLEPATEHRELEHGKLEPTGAATGHGELGQRDFNGVLGSGTGKGVLETGEWSQRPNTRSWGRRALRGGSGNCRDLWQGGCSGNSRGLPWWKDQWWVVRLHGLRLIDWRVAGRWGLVDRLVDGWVAGLLGLGGDGRNSDSGTRLCDRSASIASQVSRPLRNCSILLARDQFESSVPPGFWRAANMASSSAELNLGWIDLSGLRHR